MTPTRLPTPQRAVRLFALFVVSFLFLVACDEEPTSPPPVASLADLRDGIAFDAPVLLAPGPRWTLQDGENDTALAFRNRATLACPLPEAARDDLLVRLAVANSTRSHHFSVLWNDETLAEGLAADDDGVLELRIAASRLAAGSHTLEIRRDYRADQPEDRADHDNEFTALTYRLGDTRGELGRDEWTTRRRIADFLLTGVIGAESGDEASGWLHGGLLAVGPQQRSLALPDGSTLRVTAHNLSPNEAVFRAHGRTTEEARVAPGGEEILRVESGASPLLLEVESTSSYDDAAPPLFLWSRASLESDEANEANEPPPVILVTLDTTRRDALEPYGAAEGLTPRIGALAAESTVFENAFSTAPWTLPSHASIFTGLYPSRHGAGVSKVRLRRSPEVLAERLRSRGYVTGGISAGHLSSSEFGIAQGFDHFRDPDQWETPGTRVAEYAEEALDRMQGSAFFLWVNYFDPHALYEAPEELQERFRVPELRAEVENAPLWESFFAGDFKGWRGILEGKAEESPAALEALRASYRAEIAHTDELLGRLVDSLKRRGLYERSLVIVTADHGELLGEGGYYSHGARLDPELVEIPLLVKWPEGSLDAAAPARDDRLVSLVDLYPTVLRAAGLEPAAGDGIDLHPGAGGDVSARRYVVLEEHEALVHPLPDYMKIAAHLFGVQRRGDRRLVWDGGQQCQSFDASRDPASWTATECTAGAADVLRLLLEELGRDPDAAPAAVEIDESQVPEDQRKALEALGYI